MAHDREVGGLRCREVLALLSDYLDDECSPADRARIEAHVRGCDWCERFGGAFAGTLGRLRAELGPAAPTPAPVRARLLDRLGLVPEE